jgi:AcrR family transcriptional regulator
MPRRSIEDIRKEEIISAFFKVIAEKGLAGASTREIATVAGCSHGILRHYFGNKDGLIQNAVDFLMDDYMAEFKRGAATHTSAMDQIKYLFEVFSVEKFDMELSRAWIEIFIFSKTHAAIAKTFQEFYRTVKGKIADIIRQGIEAGEFRSLDPTITANMIFSCLDGTLFLAVVDTDNTPFTAMNEQFSEMFAGFLGAPPQNG